MMKKMITICLLAVMAFLTLSACSNAPQDDSRLRADGYFRVTLDCNGGKIGNYSERQIYAKPGFLLLEPGAEPNKLAAAINTENLEFLGWYTGTKNEDGTVEFDTKWEFSSDRMGEGDFTLYAYWREKLRFVIKGGVKGEELGFESIAKYIPSGASDTEKNLARPDVNPSWAEHTFVDYYSDSNFTNLLEFPVIHDGTPDDITRTIYAKFLEGEYTIVRTGDDLANIGRFTNLYFMEDIKGDIDMTGKTWIMPAVYSGTIIGNNKTIANLDFKIEQVVAYYQSFNFGLFGSLENAQISDLTFKDCSVSITLTRQNFSCRAGFLAGVIDSDENSKTELKNVSITGTSGVSVKLNNAAIEDRLSYHTSGLFGTAPENFDLSGCSFTLSRTLII